MKEQLEKFMDWLWLNHNILTDADKNKVALEQYLTSEQGKKALSLFSVVFSETDNMCHTCNKPIRMYDGILQQLCECERVAEVCKCLQCYPIVTTDGNLAKKCINCGIEHLQT